MLFILGAQQYSPSSAHPNEDRPMSRLAILLFGNLMLVAIAQAAPLEPPKLDITGACRDTAAQHDAATRADVLKSCVESENRARKELQEKWSRFDPTMRRCLRCRRFCQTVIFGADRLHRDEVALDLNGRRCPGDTLPGACEFGSSWLIG